MQLILLLKHIEDINPVTGRVEKEPRSSIFEDMSEEQQEYEAMKLVEQLDKLTRMNNSLLKPARFDENGRPVEIQHVLQLLDSTNDNTPSQDAAADAADNDHEEQEDG